MIPPEGGQRKLDGVIGSALPDKGCGNDEFTHENDSEHFADSDDDHIGGGVIIKCSEV